MHTFRDVKHSNGSPGPYLLHELSIRRASAVFHHILSFLGVRDPLHQQDPAGLFRPGRNLFLRNSKLTQYSELKTYLQERIVNTRDLSNSTLTLIHLVVSAVLVFLL